MLFSNKVINILNIHLNFQNTLGTSPFRTPNQVSIATFRLEGVTRFDIQRQKWRLLPGTVFLAILFIQLYLNKSRVSNVVYFESSMYFACQFEIITIKWIVISNYKQFIEQLNCLIVHELNYLQQENNKFILSRTQSLLVKFVQICGITSGIVIPIAYGIIQVVIPCSPATFAYFCNPECSDLVTFPAILGVTKTFALPALAYRLIAAGLAFWILFDTVGMFAFVVGQFLFTESYVMIYFLKSYYVQISLELKLNTVKQRTLTIYRELQIHNLFFNKINQSYVVTSVVCIVAYAFTTAMYALLKYADQGTIPQLVIFGNVTLATFIIIIFVFGIFAKVNGVSLEVLDVLEQRVLSEIIVSVKERKWMKRFIKSLSPLKVCIGQVNYVDNFTPLVMLQFCFDQIFNLMVM